MHNVAVSIVRMNVDPSHRCSCLSQRSSYVGMNMLFIRRRNKMSPISCFSAGSSDVSLAYQLITDVYGTQRSSTVMKISHASVVVLSCLSFGSCHRCCSVDANVGMGVRYVAVYH